MKKTVRGACTADFRIVTITIVDSNDQPAALDSFKVEIVNSGQDITNQLLDYFDTDGYYPVYNDSFFGTIGKKDMTVRFTGFIENEIAVKEDFIITEDCCHIVLVSGETKVVI